MRFLSLIVLAFLVIVGITFSILNAEVVAINYYFGMQRLPLSILILVVWIFGILVGMGASYFKIFKLKVALKRLHRGQA